MAKTIKFNLICDDKPVRTIEDLQNNFSVEDVLAYYDNTLLHRWLGVRGYTEELEKVSSITCKEPLEIIRELIKIFDVETDEEEIEEIIYMLEYLDERKEISSTYDSMNCNVTSIISDYAEKYKRLVEEILENPNNAAKIKANIKVLAINYKWVLDLTNRELYWTLREKSMLAVMCFLMNDKTRNYYITGENEDDKDKKTIYNNICGLITNPSFKYTLGENLLYFNGFTDEGWMNIEPKGKKYMIISMCLLGHVRPAGDPDCDWEDEDIKNKFVIVDGIDYKMKNEKDKHPSWLLYMEV